MGALDGLILRDEQWARLSGHIIGDERTRGSSGRDNRMFVAAVMWIVRTGGAAQGSKDAKHRWKGGGGSPWRDLPDVFGSWNSAFRRWSAKGIWHRIFCSDGR